MRILVLSDLQSLSPEVFDKINNKNFCDVCVSLGNVSKDVLDTIRNLKHFDLYSINTENSIHLKCIDINGVKISGVDFDEQYQYWNEHVESKFVNKLPQDIDILLTYHAPKKSVNVHGVVDKPDYAKQLMWKIQPKLHISSSEHTNAIGTAKKYQCNDIYYVYVVGAVLLEINANFQIRRFEAL